MNELQDVQNRLMQLESKVDAIFVSVEKTRKYFKATLIVTIVTIVLPAIGLAFVIPFYLNTLTGTGGSQDLINSISGASSLGQ